MKKTNILFYLSLGAILGFIGFGSVAAVLFLALACQALHFVRVPAGSLGLNLTKSTRVLVEERGALITEMEKMIKKTETEKRDLSDTEETRFSDIQTEIDTIDESLPQRRSYEEKIKADAIANGIRIDTGDGNRQSKPGTSWETREGTSLRVYAPTEQIVADRDTTELTLGSIAAALLNGPKSDTQRRALAEGQDSAGGVTVPDRVSRQFIDLFREKSATIKAGAKTVPLDSDSLTIAKIISDPVVAWRNENAEVNETQPVFAPVTWTPRSLACYIPVSRELVQDSVNIQSILDRVLSEAMGAEIDRVALVGSGTAPEPRGIANTAGVSVISQGTNGAPVTDFSTIVQAYTELLGGGANVPSAAIMSPREFVRLNSLTIADGQPLERTSLIKELQFIPTKKLPTDQVHGTATNASTIIVGDFKDLVYGVRQSIRLELLREVGFKNLQFIFLVTARIDVAVLRPESFAVIKGITA